MRLRQKQSLFVELVGQLIEYAYEKGYELTFGDASRMDEKGHMEESLHYIRLAIDLNLFVGGRWISNGDHHVWEELGQVWEDFHPMCSWGGHFGDANHFSLKHGGRR